jgi:hypothetical protein
MPKSGAMPEAVFSHFKKCFFADVVACIGTAFGGFFIEAVEVFSGEGRRPLALGGAIHEAC